MSANDAHCYATRLLNPFHGVAQIIENGQARAVSTDGLNWRVQIRSEIYKTPWSSLAIPTHYNRYFVYGVWSHTDGLARVPVHPSLYQEHVEQAVQDLLSQLSSVSRSLPFPLQDTLELWLMDAAGNQPIALLASQLPKDNPSVHKQLRWHPANNAETAFTSEAFAADQARDTIKCQSQDYLVRIIQQRCKVPYQALWIERQDDGSGQILHTHTGKTTRRHEQLEASEFPPCLLDDNWQEPQARQLIADYLDWLAPLLLTLPLPQQRRRELELKAQQRPLAVHRYYRLYPQVTDTTLLNKILVEAVMRQAAIKS